MPKTPLLRGLKSLFRDAQATRHSGVPLSALLEARQSARGKEPLLPRRAMVGALGVGAVSAALPRAAFGKSQPKIVIVGGGIAGVTCARELLDR